MRTVIADGTVLSRDLTVAIYRRYLHARKFHEECLGGQLSYYLLRKALAGERRPAVEIRTIEAAALHLMIPEVVRGVVPDAYEALRLTVKKLLGAADLLFDAPISWSNVAKFKEVCDEVKNILK